MSIRNGMYRMVFVLTVLPFLLFSLLTAGFYARRLEQVITESLQAVANAQMAEMTTFCEQQRDFLRMIGGTEAAKTVLRGEGGQDTRRYLDNLLYTRVQVMDYLDSAALVDAEDRVVACSDAHNGQADLGMDYIVEKLGSRDFYISDVLTDAQGGKSLVAIVPIREDGVTLGYGMAEIGLDFYQKLRERAELWSESTFYLLDGQQNIVSAGTPQENRDSFVTTEQERADYLEKYNAIDFAREPSGSFRYRVDGRDYITYYTAVDHTDWRIMLTVNMDRYQDNRSAYYAMGGLLVLLCAALAIWGGLFASRRIVRPIQRISGTLKDIQAGQDYSLRVAVDRRDELGRLSEGVNELIDFIETEDLYKAQQQRLLQEKAGQDALTKVLNRERIHQAVAGSMDRHRAEGTALAVLFVDVDDFKSFNTRYGHIVGDQVLQFLAGLLTKVTGGTVGRMGGDEFLALVEDPVAVGALEARLQELERLGASQFRARGSGEPVPVHFCCGAVRVDFSTAPDRPLTAEEVIQRADSAMYEVKNHGKGGHIIVDG